MSHGNIERGGKMDFFDKLGGKISQTAQVVKLNGQISDEEKRINVYLLEIGKIGYEKYAENPDSSIAEFVAQINGAKTKIEELSEQVRKLKGFIKCEQCGADIPPNNPFCSDCGSKVEVQSASVPVSTGDACKNCGASTTADLAFCMDCGTKIEMQSAEVQLEIGLSCKSCGESMKADIAFCENCGQKRESAEEA